MAVSILCIKCAVTFGISLRKYSYEHVIEHQWSFSQESCCMMWSFQFPRDSTLIGHRCRQLHCATMLRNSCARFSTHCSSHWTSSGCDGVNRRRHCPNAPTFVDGLGKYACNSTIYFWRRVDTLIASYMPALGPAGRPCAVLYRY